MLLVTTVTSGQKYYLQMRLWLFKENKLVDRKVGNKFMKKILETGGSKPALELFVDFRGREPIIEPLLKSLGLK